MNNPTGAAPAVSFADVRVGFGRGRQRVEVIDDVSFDVAPGEFVSVLGPSGCGKSTLLNLAAGFLRPDAGQVACDGVAVTGPDHRRGVVFQQYAIFPWLTVEKNIGFGLTLGVNRRPRAERQATVARYVELMGLTGFEKALPKTLSGGMRQRVALARAYATGPDVLLLDEPFAALDAQTRELMQELLHDTGRTERRTAMLITHSVEEAIYLSHRIVVLGNRPTRVREVLDVPVAFPRTPDSRLEPDFLALRRHLEQLMRSLADPYPGPDPDPGPSPDPAPHPTPDPSGSSR